MTRDRTTTYDRTPCPQRAAELPCVRSFTDAVCVTCRRELPLTHPTSRDQSAELFRSDEIPVKAPPDSAIRVAVQACWELIDEAQDERVPLGAIRILIHELSNVCMPSEARELMPVTDELWRRLWPHCSDCGVALIPDGDPTVWDDDRRCSDCWATQVYRLGGS